MSDDKQEYVRIETARSLYARVKQLERAIGEYNTAMTTDEHVDTPTRRAALKKLLEVLQ